VVVACGLGRAGRRSVAHGLPGTPGRVRGGPGKCRVNATCVHDPAPCAAPDGRWGSSSVPGGGPTSGAVRGTLAGRTRASATKCLLRDHAPPQARGSSVLAAEMGRVAGAHVASRRARFWPHRRDAVWPAAAPPASAGPGAGIRRPGSNAGSNAAAGTGGHSLCASRAAAAVVADWHGGGGLAYHDHSQWERDLPRDSPGRTRYRSPRALIKTGKQTASLYGRA
jgi:hypothetical protein